MKAHGLFMMGCFCLALNVFPGNTDDAEIIFPELEGFELVQDYPVYYPDNLWDYINGAADAYLEFGFMDLHIAEYVSGDTKYKVEIYRHKDPTNGFGIYAQERSPDYHFIRLGVQGYSEETLVHFLKGPYYVKITTYYETGDSERNLMFIAKKIESILDGPDTFPSMLEAFPDAGKIENAEAFIARNFLGYSFMSNVLTARYGDQGNEYTLFIIDVENKELADAILEKLAARALSSDEWTPGNHVIEDRYNGTLYFTETPGGILLGALGNLTRDRYEENISLLKSGLK